MPYDRDQVVKAVTDYYEFLTRLHVEDDDIKWPPPEGWPSITKDRFGPLDKTDKVIELLRHLPYVQNEHDFTPTQVWPLCGCADYTGWECEIQLGRGFGKYGPDIVEYSDCLWEKLHRPHPHIITLASPADKYGGYIMCDTEDGECAIWSFWEDEYSRFDGAEQCFAYMKKAFLELKVWPVGKQRVIPLSDRRGDDQQTRGLAREHLWPSDGFQWQVRRCSGGQGA